jgi:membrane-associated phospholipid phosphatase
MRPRPSLARHWPWAAGLLLLGSTAAHAQPTPATSLSDYADTAWDGTVSVVTAPLHWDGTAWLEFGGATAAVVGTSVILDRPIRNAARRSHASIEERFANRFEDFGAGYSFGVLGAFYLDGLIVHNDRARLVAEDGLTASIVSGGITYLLKEGWGRARPTANKGTYDFFAYRGNTSFPSGHATQAFAVASVIAAHYGDNPWVDTAAYGVASLVGMARIDHDAHFASDVLAGAIIGTVVGRAIVRHRAATRRRVSLTPVVAPQWNGLIVGLSF